MTAIRDFFQNLFYAIPSIGVTDVVDILVVAFIIYSVLCLIRSTSAARVACGILLLLIVTWLTEAFNLYALNWMLGKILEIGVIAIVIVFQPELRRGLEKVGGNLVFRFLNPDASAPAETSVIRSTVAACEVMSKEKIGVLLVFERKESLNEYFKTGTVVDAAVSEPLLRNLFFPKASLHDGAVIIRNGRVAAAGCVMPLSENTHLSTDLGTRHRAGIGTSEVSDAVVVIVSEETGTISVAIGGMLKRHLAPQTLERILTNELVSNEDKKNQNVLERIRSDLSKRNNQDEKQ